MIRHIKSRTWGHFDNKGMDLLIRSIQLSGFHQMNDKIEKKMFLEDMVVDYGDDRQIKVFSLRSFFSEADVDYFLTNPELISDYLERFEILTNQSLSIIDTLERELKTKNPDVVESTTRLISVFYEISFWKYFLSAIAHRLFRKSDTHKNAEGIIKQLNLWKNNSKYYNIESSILIEISHHFSMMRNLPIEGWEIVKYLHVNEYLDFLNDDFENKTLDLVTHRKNHGYISLNLDHSDFNNLLLDILSAEGQEIKKYIESIFHDHNHDNQIKGQVIAKQDGIINGECVVISNFKDLPKAEDLNDKILVTRMTTPQFLPYIKGIKAIITDVGGIMCHAAIIARELGIPAIIGTRIATSRLKNGDSVEMDFKKSLVRKV